MTDTKVFRMLLGRRQSLVALRLDGEGHLHMTFDIDLMIELLSLIYEDYREAGDGPNIWKGSRTELLSKNGPNGGLEPHHDCELRLPVFHGHDDPIHPESALP
jgi:hypothetical protein